MLCWPGLLVFACHVLLWLVCIVACVALACLSHAFVGLLARAFVGLLVMLVFHWLACHSVCCLCLLACLPGLCWLACRACVALFAMVVFARFACVCVSYCVTRNALFASRHACVCSPCFVGRVRLCLLGMNVFARRVLRFDLA